LRTALAIAVVAAALTAASSNGAVASFAPGVKSVGGVSARVFCGSAKATVRYHGQTWTFAQGACERLPAYFDVNVGTVVLGQTSKKRPDYFGLTVGKYPGSTGKAAAKDGTYVGGVLAVVHAGKGLVVDARTVKVTLTKGRTRGTFTAKAILSDSGTVSGSFGC
jgi:hypothetical protein